MAKENKKQAKMKHLVSHQGSEIKKYIKKEISKYTRLQNLDPIELEKTIEVVEEIIKNNAKGLTLVKGIVEGNKNEIKRAKKVLGELIVTEIKKLTDSVEEDLEELSANIVKKITKAYKSDLEALEERVDIKLKELAKSEEMDVLELCSDFTASLWGDGNYILLAEKIVNMNRVNINSKINGEYILNTNLHQHGFKGDEFIKVSTVDRFTLSGNLEINGQVDVKDKPNQYLGYAAYDIDKKLILSHHIMKSSGATDTYFASDVKPGDKELHIEDCTGWCGVDGKDVNRIYSKSIVWYGYKNSKGFVYPDFTYTRYTSVRDLWANGNVVKQEDGTWKIKLKKAWSGPEIKKGTAVRNNNSGGTYQYVTCPGRELEAGNYSFSAEFGGEVITDGVNHYNKWRPGTEYIKTLVLTNYYTKTDVNVIWSDIKFESIESTGNEVYLKVSGDHFNPMDSGLDFGKKGSPLMRVRINDKLLVDEYIDAVKIFNQYQEFKIYSPEEVKKVEVQFVRDAWEGGKDKNLDGLSEDRNLWVFETRVNGKELKPEDGVYQTGKTQRAIQEGMFWQGSLIYSLK
jgi:hypothetical protein